MGGFGGWPVALPKNTATLEAFDRTRLLIDLDEATDPEAEPSLLVIVGVPRGAERMPADPAARLFVARLEETIGHLVGDAGSIYRTRATEVCALVDGGVSELREVLTGIEAELARDQRPSIPAVVGVVSLPEEATEAVAALALADERMSRHGGLDPETLDPEGAARRAARVGAESALPLGHGRPGPPAGGHAA
jgi:hypothetical protein